MVKSQPCSQIDLAAFSRWATSRRRLADRSLRNYLVWLKDAEAYAHRNGKCLVSADTSLLSGYLETLPPTASTRNCAIAAFKTFYAFLAMTGTARNSATAGLKMWRPPARVPQPIDPERICPFLDACFADSTMLGTLAVLFLNTSLRLDELRLRRKSQLHGRRLFLIQKGGQERIVILSDEAVETIAEWLRACPENSVWLFPSPRRPELPVSATWVYNHIREAGENSGIPNMHPHRLRHTGISEYYRLTKDPAATQRYAGHTDFSTTQGYIKLVDAEGDPFIANLRFRTSS